MDHYEIYLQKSFIYNHEQILDVETETEVAETTTVEQIDADISRSSLPKIATSSPEECKAKCEEVFNYTFIQTGYNFVYHHWECTSIYRIHETIFSLDNFTQD